jgi:hypothetical protein
MLALKTKAGDGTCWDFARLKDGAGLGEAAKCWRLPRSAKALPATGLAEPSLLFSAAAAARLGRASCVTADQQLHAAAHTPRCG